MSTRLEKLRALLIEEISDIILRELKDPRLGFITVIDAEITPDLQHAKVFVSIMGSKEEQAINLAVLRRSAHFVRQSFGKRIKMKVLPDFDFVLDESVERGVRMFELLQQIQRDDDDQGT